MGTSLVVRTQIKDLAKVGEKQLSVAADFYEEIDKKVLEIIRKACLRAAANNRTTVMGRDI